MNLKKYRHLPAIAGGVVTAVRKEEGQIVYKYRVPAHVMARQEKAKKKLLKGKGDPDDIGQGEGCEGGKCGIK